MSEVRVPGWSDEGPLEVTTFVLTWPKGKGALWGVL